MRFSASYVPAVLLSLLTFSVSHYAQSTTKQTSKTPAGTVSGRVTIKEKGVAGILVGLRKADQFNPLEPHLKATTDYDGFYRITNVPVGSYEVMPSAPAYVMAGAGTARAKHVIVNEDEEVSDINFSLVRGGVITGKVTDADGRPVIQQPVQLFRIEVLSQPQTPERPVFPTTAGQTDDRGIYRMFGLLPGRYKVGSGRSEGVFMTPVAPRGASYRQVFHPDATDPAEAKIIDVTEGSEATNVDITLGRLLQLYSMSGRVVDAEKGLPAPNVRFGLQRNMGQRFEFVNSSSVSNAQGDFLVEGLTPGKYSVFLVPNQNLDLRVETSSFDIMDHDLSGITIRLIKGVTLTGVITFEGGEKPPLEKLSEMQLRAYVAAAGVYGMAQSALSPISPDGSFKLGGLGAGTVNLSLGTTMGPPPRGFNITRVERDGIVFPRGIEVKEGEILTGLRVFVSHGSATLRGLVKLENGSLPEGARIFVRINKPGDTATMMIPPQVDSRGQFLMEGLVPGVYELTVSITGAPPGPRPVKREVTVQAGVVTDVMITLDMTTTTPRP